MCGALKDADWFNDSNEEGVEWRNKCNQAALSDMSEYLHNVTMGVAILDATNGSHEKRLTILQMVRWKQIIMTIINAALSYPSTSPSLPLLPLSTSPS
jgi:hypothetical protein